MSTIYFAQLISISLLGFGFDAKTTQKHTEREAFGGILNTAEKKCHRISAEFGTHHVHTQCVPRPRRGLDSVPTSEMETQDLLTWWLRGIMILLLPVRTAACLPTCVCWHTQCLSGKGWVKRRVVYRSVECSRFTLASCFGAETTLRPPAHTTISQCSRICVDD